VAVRIGIDVGGTFTKAVACDVNTGRIMCSTVVPTTSGPEGVTEGVVQALYGVSSEVVHTGCGPVVLVAHSTTQAVNALLQGDTATVGVLGLGRPPDVRRARKRTRVGAIDLAPGRTLSTHHAFVGGSTISEQDVRDAVRSLVDQGAEALAVSESYSVDDPSGEVMALDIAAEMGLPACAGHELSGLYGLELRTVTAAINASILPTALHTATSVERTVYKRLPGASLVVMRGDGGAAEISTMRRRPLLTAFSGPAASVAGALHHMSLVDAIVIEVGGTSTNVSVVRGGRPILSYVRVLDHATSVRSLDVRVLGIGGGSMIRVAGRGSRTRLAGVGPRSAHIAGLEYASFTDPRTLEGSSAELTAPCPGDPPEYVVLRTKDGRHVALTLTCAANALGRLGATSYAKGDADSARIGFEALGRLLGADWWTIAEQTVDACARTVSTLVQELMRKHEMPDPALVGVGGGASTLVPDVAKTLGLDHEIPPHAEVISSVGSALSLVRVELERSAADVTRETLAQMVAQVEEAAAAAGAEPQSLQVETEAIPERRTIRAVALGSIAAAGKGRPELGDGALRAVAERVLGTSEPLSLGATSEYSVFGTESHGHQRFAVLDKRGTVVTSGEGLVLSGEGELVAAELREHLDALTRQLGGFTIPPAVRIVRAHRVVDLSLVSSPAHAAEAAVLECTLADGEPVVALVSRN
jgi:N-methylhydantoinase A/oxoprolinase/acetone carboxylase beta subunit